VSVWPAHAIDSIATTREILKLIKRFNGSDISLRKQMGSQYAHELPRVDDLGFLPELWEMLLIAGNEVVRACSVGTFDEHIVVRVAGHFKAPRWGNDMAVTLDQLDQLLPEAPANIKVRARKHACIFLQDRF
jgi:hypothetical protein